MVGFLLVLSACALWALDTLIRYPLVNEGMSAYPVVLFEHFVLTIVCLSIFYRSIPQLLKARKTHILYFFIVGGIGSALSTLAFTRAFHFINPSLVILLQKFQPVVAISLAHVVLKERVGKQFLIWASVCLLGALMISYQDLSLLLESRASFFEQLFKAGSLQGYFLILFSVVGWGSATVFGKKLVSVGYQDEQILAGRFSFGLLSLLPFLITEGVDFHYTVDNVSKITMMTLFSGLLAMYLFYHGLRKISARSCALVEMTFPFMAVIVHWLFLGATLSLHQIMGGLLLLLGSVVIQVKRY